jgi:uncharacterized cupredoxin-like copper-binding protein
MKTVRLLLLAVSILSGLVLAACGGQTGGNTGGGSGTLSLEADGENLAYKPVTLSATAGSPVKVTFKNTSTAQQHNFVLVNGGDDVASTVDEEAVAAGPPDYVPAGSPNVLANTAMLAPGASGEASFTAPAAGTYTFICTYPGHYAAGMKGTLTVQ